MEFIYSHPALSALQTAFTIWMLVDAYRRHAEGYWFFVILFLPFLGAWAYFFAVKRTDFGYFRLPVILQSRQSLDELRFRCEQTPTVATHLALAERLMEKEEYAEALSHLEAAAKIEPDYSRLHYCRAQCHLRLGKPDLARQLLDRLIEKDPRWSNYLGWHLLIETLDQSGDGAGSLQICRQLIKLAPGLQHQCILAEHLLDAGQKDEAVKILQGALQEFNYVVGPSWRLNQGWARVARKLLKRATG